MPFSEAIKTEVKRRAHFSCCICRETNVHIHHIIPENEDGLSTIENAAPLCPSCHDLWGGNPQKRKMIAEARDLWYEVCDTRYASDSSHLQRIEDKLDSILCRFGSAPLDPGELEATSLFPHSLSDQTNAETGEQSSLFDAVRYLILGFPLVESNPYVNLISGFDGEVLGSPPWAAIDDTAVEEVRFSDAEELRQGMEILQQVLREARGDQGFTEERFAAAIDATLLPHLVQKVSEHPSDRSLASVTSDHYLVLGVDSSKIVWFQLMTLSTRLDQKVNLAPKSTGLRFSSYDGMQAWCNMIQRIQASGHTDTEIRSIFAEEILKYATRKSSYGHSER